MGSSMLLRYRVDQKDEHDNRPHETSYYLQGSKKLNSPVFMKRKHKTMSFLISMI